MSRLHRRSEISTGRPSGRGRSRFPGVLDLQGTLSRAQGTRVHRYLPLSVGKDARDYVRESVQQGSASGVKFRVNRGAIVLNDLDSGAAWDVDRDQQKKIDNWDALIPPPQTENDNDKKDKNNKDNGKRG